MPYPEPHSKVTVYGDAYNGAEHWSFGWRMANADPTGENSQARANLFGPIVSAWWTNVNTAPFFSSHRLQGVKVAQIDQDGKYPVGHIPGEVFFANVPGALATPVQQKVKPQDSICVTLTTAVPRGLATKGRFFLPPNDIAVGADGLIAVNVQGILVGWMHDFLTAINNAEVGNADISIYSRGRGLPAYDAVKHKVTYTYPNPGAVNRVTRVEIGRVIDTQRRRRRQLVEARTGVALG